ncbi:hypothetical protein GYMLUDRAFT_61498 [Collybiopsis luxurians FD-317 M1]|uniref:Uncharacterized protein n=1 Tax=Collybiopsis luxurians FD-317 M1 TaxID=944289 RepID=A0A0D0CGA3_9AGAR|nr:hypothetical protein GYMLUDRAFT_61498 [Collybiopsis luxurians FD-317 M1]
MGFQKFRLGHASAANAAKSKRASSNCLTGGFYTNPTSGATIDSLKPLNITWETSCITPAENLVDIYLYAPAAASPRLHLWENVDYTKGSYEATLMPRWWNSSSSEQLQLLIIQSGDAPFLATLPAGPVFTATYTTPSSGVPASAQTSLSSTSDQITNVKAASASTSSSSHLSGGKVAAAVIMPLLVVAAIGAFLWLRRSRTRGRAKSQMFSEKLDRRMSVVSADWQSTTAAGAQAAIRTSMAIRASMAMENDSRLSMSQANMGINLAGMGVQAPGGGVGGFFIPGQDDPTVNPIVSMPVPAVLPETGINPVSHLRPGLRSSAYSNAAAAARVSRVSFAAEPTIPGRPSGESRRSIYERERPSIDTTGTRRSTYSQSSRGSRAFHYAEGEMPPMPEGAAERASQFYMLNSNANISGTIGSGVGLGHLRTSHMNVSSSSLGSGSQDASRMSRMSRFDEVYGEDYTPESDTSRTSSDAGVMSPTQTQGPVALTTEDIKRRISMRQKSFDSEQPKASFDYSADADVGPALSMMRAQEQEEGYFTQYPYAITSETLFSTSPSPQQSSFPSFPMPSLSGAVLPQSPVMASAELSPASPTASVTSSYTGMAPPRNEASPDDMLRAYAKSKKGSRAATPNVSNPSPLGRASVLNEGSEDGHGHGHAI